MSSNEQYLFLEATCYLKTKSDRFKKHVVVLMGNEIYFYKVYNDKEHFAMHTIVHAFVKEMPEERAEE